ncbi:MAG: DUF4340 domain-containing protein [Candidatus Zixiibacteriota bacterium]
MKNSNKYILILVIVLLVLAGLYFINSARRGSGTIEKPKDINVAADSTAISKIELFMKEDTVVIEKQNDKWMLTSPVLYRADQAAIKRLVNSISNAKLDVEISSNTEKHGEYNVDEENGRYIKITENDGDIIEYWVGKMGPAGMTYIRFDGDRRVWLLNSQIGSSLRRSAKDFRDKVILQIEPDQLAGISVHSPEQDFYLALEDSVWKFSESKAGEAVEPDSGKVDTYINRLRNIRTQDFIDDTDSIANVSFEEPDFVANIMLKDGKSHKIEAVFAGEKQRNYLTRIDGEESTLFKISTGVLNRFARDKEYMTSPAPPPPPPGQQQMNMGGQGMGGPGGQQMTPEMQRKIQEAMRKQQMQQQGGN